MCGVVVVVGMGVVVVVVSIGVVVVDSSDVWGSDEVLESVQKYSLRMMDQMIEISYHQ